MQPPKNMTAIIDRKRYNTATATLLCGDDHWDGQNFERRGTNQFLYRTPRGVYFFVNLTQWQGCSDHIEPCSEGEAINFFEFCQEQRVSYQEAFPQVNLEDA